MRFNQGEIVLMPFPFSDLSSSKRRPALVVSNKNLKGDDLICCLITSNVSKEGFEIKKNDFYNGNLPFTSWVKPERIFTIDKNRIIKKLATVQPKFLKKVISKFEELIKLN